MEGGDDLLIFDTEVIDILSDTDEPEETGREGAGTAPPAQPAFAPSTLPPNGGAVEVVEIVDSDQEEMEVLTVQPKVEEDNDLEMLN